MPNPKSDRSKFGQMSYLLDINDGLGAILTRIWLTGNIEGTEVQIKE